MKATKKIVGAAVALVAAVALSAGSTFAWFSSNGNVTATGLEVNVKTDNSYLVIAANTGAITSATETTDLTTLNIAKTDTPVLKPSAYKTKEANGSFKDPTKEGGATETDAPSVVTVGTWYTAQGKNSVDGSIKDGTKEALTSWTDYVVESDFVVSVATGSVAISHIYATMNVTLPTDTSKKVPLQVVFLYQYVAKTSTEGSENFGTVDATAYTKVDVAATGSLGKLDLVPSGGSVSAYDHIAIKVLVYMDGNNADVTTEKQATLAGATINFTFSNDAPAVPGGGGS